MKRIVLLVCIVVLVASMAFTLILNTDANELEAQLQASVGESNTDPKFDLFISAPETCSAGDEIEIVVSVRNITAESGIDFIDFEFRYDPAQLTITNDIDEGDLGSIVCFDSDTLGGGWMNFSSASSNYDELTPDDIRAGVQAVPTNDGLVNASALTANVYLDAVFDDDALYFTFTFLVNDNVDGDIGVYVPNSSVKAGANTESSIINFLGNGSYSIITFNNDPIVDESSVDSSNEPSEDISNDSSDDISEDTSVDVSDVTSDDTSSEISEDEDVSYDPEVVERLENAVGEKNENPEFDIVIDAPAKYRAGDEIEVLVSIKNITAQYGLDYFKFDFYYDETKLMLTNDLDERDYGNLVCIDLSALGKSWENFTIVSSNYKDLTADDLRQGVQAVATNDGLIEASVFTSNMYTDSVKDDGVLTFVFTFKVMDDATGDIGMYVSNSSIKGALNVDTGLEYHNGNGSYDIMVLNTDPIPEPEPAPDPEPEPEPEPEPPHECVGGDWQYDETNHWKVCECGETVESAGHVEGEWEVVTEPQIEIPGEKVLRCTECGYLIESSVIDPLPKPENPTFEYLGFMIKLSEDSTHYIVVDYIGDSREVTIPDYYEDLPISEINSAVFFECDSIVGIAIPETISIVPENVFADCSSLEMIYVFAEQSGEEWAENWLGDCNAEVRWGYDCYDAQTELEPIIEKFDALIESDYSPYEWEILSNAFESAKGYAPENNTIFEYVRMLDSLEFIFDDNPALKEFGDINDDGFVNGVDYLLAKRICFFTYNANRNEFARTDMDRNELIDNTDYMRVKRISFGTFIME